MNDKVQVCGAGATYRRELSPMYRTPSEASKAKARIIARDPYCDCRIVFLPIMRKWVVVE